MQGEGRAGRRRNKEKEAAATFLPLPKTIKNIKNDHVSFSLSRTHLLPCTLQFLSNGIECFDPLFLLAC